MSRRAHLVRDVDAGDAGVWFYCPGCETHHRIVVGRWSWNASEDLPTFAPSVLVRFFQLSPEGIAMIDRGDPPPAGGRYPGADVVCHSFVRDGRIEYLADSTHRYAGQTIDLPPIDDSM